MPPLPGLDEHFILARLTFPWVARPVAAAACPSWKTSLNGPLAGQKCWETVVLAPLAADWQRLIGGLSAAKLADVALTVP